MTRALWPIGMATLMFLLACLTGSALNPGPTSEPRQDRAGAREVSRPAQDTQTPRDALLAHLEAIRQAAVQAGRATRDSTVGRAAQAILEQVQAAEAVLGAVRSAGGAGSSEPTEPPSQGGGSDPGAGSGGIISPPPPGPWVTPTDVGAAPPWAQTLFSQWGHNIANNGLQDLADADVTAISKGGAVVSTDYRGAGPIAWTNVRVRPVDPSDKTKWAFKAWDVEQSSFTGCTFEDVPVEHGQYINAIGGIRWERCLWRNCGSQAVQVVYAIPGSKRSFETGLGAGWQSHVNATAGEWHEVLDSAVVQCGLPTGARPSYALSFFGGAAHPVRVARCYIRTATSFDNNGPRQSYGAVMAHGRGRFELLETFIEYPQGDRSVVQVWHCGDVLLRGNMVLADQEVDVRVKPGDTVEIAGNIGSTCEVIVSTNPAGVQFNAGFDPGLIVYRGPLAADVKVQVP